MIADETDESGFGASNFVVDGLGREESNCDGIFVLSSLVFERMSWSCLKWAEQVVASGARVSQIQP